MKKLLFLFVALLTSIGTWAFEVDGINYAVVSEEDKTVNVTGYNSSYAGDLVINGTVTYNEAAYKVVSIRSYALCYCSKSISVGSLSYCLSIGDYAFQSCRSLTSIGDLSACTSVGESAFEYCSSLTSIGDLSACTTIEANAFISCSSLTSIGDLSACTTIGSNAFRECSILTSSVDLSACTSIGVGAFVYCPLETVTLPSTPPTLSGSISDTGTTFLVPAAAVATYRAADYWSDIKMQIISKDATHTWDVAAPVLTSIGPEQFENVMTLKLSGNIDSDDIMYIRNKMFNLHHLDLTNVTVLRSEKEYATGRRTYDDQIGGFDGLVRLRTAKLPTSAKVIERKAFTSCFYLYDITIPEGIKIIEDGYGETGAFYGCDPKTVQFPEGLTRIGSRAFSYCSRLQAVAFPSTLTSIGDYAFYNTRLTSVSLPESLTSIGEYAFQYNSSLAELRIPSSVETIGSQAFAGCSGLKDIYTYTAQPTHINSNTFSSYAAATLHCPDQGFNDYYASPTWGQFPELVAFNEPYKYFYITDDFILLSGKRFEAEQGEDVDYQGNAGSSITIEGEGDQDLGYMDLYFDGTKWASVIANENLTAKHVRFHIPVTGNRWYFYSFPFRVYLNKVTAPGSYVFRRYDGLLRALSGASGWAALSEGTTYLEPGVGYIFQCNTTGELVIEIDSPDFYWHGSYKTNTLTAHTPGTGISDQHASWNFVGNPMTSYYDIDDMGYTSPLTFWNGSSYVAYRPGDDNYQLSPFEAFFVQKPASDSNPTYQKEHRMGYNASQKKHSDKAAARRMEQGPRDRHLLNLVLSNGTDEDKTRVVFNEKMTKDYEMECDAAKFMSSEQVPQLFSVYAQTRYAINERPQGEVMLGFTAPVAGCYTLRAERMDMPVVVKDLVMGTTHELENGEYTFDTEAGTFENRFVLMPAGNVTAVRDKLADGAETESIHRLDGKQLPATAKGVNIVRKGNEVQKVMVK